MSSLPLVALVLVLGAAGARAAVVKVHESPLAPALKPLPPGNSPSAAAGSIEAEVDNLFACQDYNAKLKAVSAPSENDKKQLVSVGNWFADNRKGLLEDMKRLRDWAESAKDADSIVSALPAGKGELKLDSLLAWSGITGADPRDVSKNTAKAVDAMLSTQSAVRLYKEKRDQAEIDRYVKSFLSNRAYLLEQLDKLEAWAQAAKDVDSVVAATGAAPRKAPEKSVDPEKIKKGIGGVIKLEGDPTTPAQPAPPKDKLEDEVKKKVESLIKKDEKPRGIPGAIRRKKRPADPPRP